MAQATIDGNLLDINETPVIYKSSSGVLSNNYTITDGVITINGATNIAWLVNCKEQETYEFRIKSSYAGGSRLLMRIYYVDEQIDFITSATPTAESKYVSATEDSFSFTVPAGTNYVYAGIYADYRIAGTTISELTLQKA